MPSTSTYLLRTCIRKEKLAVPIPKVKTLEAFIRKLSPSSVLSLRGSSGGSAHGCGRYLEQPIQSSPLHHTVGARKKVEDIAEGKRKPLGEYLDKEHKASYGEILRLY